MVMPSNQTGTVFGWMAGAFPGRVGHLYSPGAQQGPFHFFPYALDNGAFSAFTSGAPWDEAAWKRLLGVPWLRCGLAADLAAQVFLRDGIQLGQHRGGRWLFDDWGCFGGFGHNILLKPILRI